MPLSYCPAMELRHLRYFVAVAEERNFTRAAARLHRAKGGIPLTAAGNEYLARARKLLADSAAAVRVTQALGRSEHRQLLIGIVEPLMSSGRLAKILQNSSSARPEVRVELRELFSVEQHRLIAARQLDAGF